MYFDREKRYIYLRNQRKKDQFSAKGHEIFFQGKKSRKKIILKRNVVTKRSLFLNRRGALKRIS